MQADTTDRQLYTIKDTGGGASIIGVNVTIQNVGRTTEGCDAHLAVGAASVGQCQTSTSGLGSAASPGAQKWRLDNVPGEPSMVLISNEVRVSVWVGAGWSEQGRVWVGRLAGGLARAWGRVCLPFSAARTPPLHKPH